MNSEKYYILLAEDDEDDRLFFKEAFAELRINSELTIVNDGVQLMDYLLQDNIALPHLIFLDVNMPRKNGIKALQEIRNHPKLKNLTVAIYSTSAAQSDIENALLNGANIYINKPDDFEDLKKLIAKALAINWQYRSSELNKDNFILNIG